jgi:hypothetical protein
LKRYEQPPPDYFENFLHEFHRRPPQSDHPGGRKNTKQESLEHTRVLSPAD